MVHGPSLMFGFLFEIGVLLLETFYSAGGIDELMFAGKERVAVGADFNGISLGTCGEGFDLIPARTSDNDFI